MLTIYTTNSLSLSSFFGLKTLTVFEGKERGSALVS